MVKTRPTKLGEGKLAKPAGPGLKIATYNVSLGPKNSQVNAKDLELRSLHAIFPMTPPTKGTSLIGSVNNAGSPDNYASFSFVNYATGAVAPAITAGSLTVKMLVVGE